MLQYTQDGMTGTEENSVLTVTITMLTMLNTCTPWQVNVYNGFEGMMSQPGCAGHITVRGTAQPGCSHHAFNTIVYVNLQQCK